MRRTTLLTLALVALTAVAAFAETCLSPYVKGLRQPEKVMYVWTLPAREGADYLSVIDVNLASPTYGQVLRKVEVGSSGNEAHHMGFTDDRTKIWAASLNTSRFFIFDVGGDPMNPRLVLSEAAQIFVRSSVKPKFNRMVTSSWVPQRTFMSPL